MRLTSTEIRHGGSMLGKPLGEREREAMGYVVAGMTNEEIGDVLGVSKHTAHDYIERACRKLGARNRTAAAVMAIGHGVVEMPAWAKPQQPAFVIERGYLLAGGKGGAA